MSTPWIMPLMVFFHMVNIHEVCMIKNFIMFTWHEKYVLANNYHFSLTSHMTLQIHITNMKMHYLPSFLTCWPLSLMPNYKKFNVVLLIPRWLTEVELTGGQKLFLRSQLSEFFDVSPGCIYIWIYDWDAPNSGKQWKHNEYIRNIIDIGMNL